MKDHANDDQTACHPGPARIHWNPARRDLRILAASILGAGALNGGGAVWSAHVESQAVRCAGVTAAFVTGPGPAWGIAETLAAGEGTAGDIVREPWDASTVAPALRQLARANGCDDALLLGD